MLRSLIRRLIFGGTVSERRRQHARALDGQLPTPDQQRRFGEMATYAFVFIRGAEDIDLARAVADAFHNLPAVVYSPCFSWSHFLMELELLERLYPEVGRWHIAAYDKIMGFQAEPDGGGPVNEVVRPRSPEPEV